MPRKRVLAAFMVLLLLAVILLLPGWAQRQYQELQRLFYDLDTHRRPPDSTEFIFARVQYTTTRAARGFRGFRRLEGWAHDYPEAEEHILQLASEATTINLNKTSYVIVRLDSEELFQYPFAYFSEVGEMDMTEREAANFREYLNRGGFAMVDDFDSRWSLDWFASQMRKVFPDRHFVELKVDHSIFHTLYDIPTLDVYSPYNYGEPPRFYGYFDDHGRLCMIINHNNDMGDFWEWIDQPMFPLESSTEAIRIGLNYFLYSLTH